MKGKVRSTVHNKTGTALGTVFKYGVWWVLVEWSESKSQALVHESALELLEPGKQ